MPGTTDVLFALVFAVLWPLWNHFIDWPRHLRAVAAGDPRARTRLYRQTILEQWALAAVAIALTVIYARSATTLGITAPAGWRLWAGIALPVAYGVLAVAQIRALRGRPAASLVRTRASLEPLRPLIPQTEGEFRWFVPLSITAGICEELLFRGYLIWMLTPWFGLFGSAVASAVVFGLAHSYQGGKFGTRAFVAGFVMTGLFLVTRSIIPGIVLHALVDIVGGYVGFMVLREPPAMNDAQPIARSA